jgi:RimJ/RimL family protein N-acetyltransferase
VAFIETERTLLRTWMPQDAPAWLAVVTKPAVARFLPSTTPRTIDDMHAWIDAKIEHQEREGFSAWPVVRKSDGALIGICGLMRGEDGGVEMGWAFDESVWGQGFATEAARAVLAFAAGNLGITRLYALIDPANSASVRVANRIGLRFDCVVRVRRRDLLRYRN